MKPRAFIRICVGVALAVAAQLCAADADTANEGKALPLEMLWKNGSFADASRAELAVMLSEVPHRRMGDKQWRVQDCEKMQFAGETMQDVLFVWKEVGVSKRAGSRGGKGGTETRLDHISCLLYNRADAKMPPFATESEVKRLTDFLGKAPKKQRSKDSKTQTTTWLWSTRSGSAELSVVSHKKGSKDVVDSARLTLAPLRKEPKMSAADKKAAECEKKKGFARSEPDVDIQLQERLSEWKDVNAPDHVEPGPTDPVALLAFIEPEMDAHELALKVYAASRKVREELSRLNPKLLLCVSNILRRVSQNYHLFDWGRNCRPSWEMVAMNGSNSRHETNRVNAPECFREVLSNLPRRPVLFAVKGDEQAEDGALPMRLWLMLEYDSVQRTITYVEFFKNAIVKKSVSIGELQKSVITQLY